jgi:predicted nucleic acid-binding protein
MTRYRDRPMDFADAMLVHLAHQRRISRVFTVDHDDFETYRLPGKKRFHIVPGRIA